MPARRRATSSSAPSTGRAGKNGITAFVVEADTPGFRLGIKERKMGIRGTTGYELVFEDARVPAENRLGEEGDGLTRRALGARRRAASASPPAAPGSPATRSSWRPATPSSGASSAAPSPTRR